MVERNGWIFACCSVLAIAVGWVVGLSADEWRWLGVVIALLLIAELLNTAVEHLGDAVTLEHDEHIGRAKDLGSAAVLIATLAALWIAATIFVPHFVRQ